MYILVACLSRYVKKARHILLDIFSISGIDSSLLASNISTKTSKTFFPPKTKNRIFFFGNLVYTNSRHFILKSISELCIFCRWPWDLKKTCSTKEKRSNWLAKFRVTQYQSFGGTKTTFPFLPVEIEYRSLMTTLWSLLGQVPLMEDLTAVGQYIHSHSDFDWFWEFRDIFFVL